jgi:hypothetical protein
LVGYVGPQVHHRGPVGAAILEGIAKQVVDHRAQVMRGKVAVQAGGDRELRPGQQRGQVQVHSVQHGGQIHRLSRRLVDLLQPHNVGERW